MEKQIPSKENIGSELDDNNVEKPFLESSIEPLPQKLPYHKIEMIRQPSDKLFNNKKLNSQKTGLALNNWNTVLNEIDEERIYWYHSMRDFFWDEYAAVS